MNTKHTPGPWELTHTGNRDDFRGLRTWISAEGGTIAAVFSCGNPRRAFDDEALSDLPEPSDGAIGQANARLIAEAPALLDVLQTIVRQCGARLNEASGNTALLSHAEAVIAKVHGPRLRERAVSDVDHAVYTTG